MAHKLVKHDGPSAKGGNSEQLKSALASSMSKFAHGAAIAPTIVKVSEPGKHTHTHTKETGPATSRVERIIGPATTRIEKTIDRLPAGLSSDMESINRVLAPHGRRDEPPAAGRAMQLIKAQQAAESGKAKPTAELAQITQLIRDGGHKAVAGVPPERVREILQNTTKTVQLPGQPSDPDVRLINQKFEGPLHLAHKTIDRSDTGIRTGRATAPTEKPPTESRSVNDSQVINKLVNMVDTNETTHVGMAEQEAKSSGGTVVGVGGIRPVTSPSPSIRGGLSENGFVLPASPRHHSIKSLDAQSEPSPMHPSIRLLNDQSAPSPVHHSIKSPDIPSEPKPAPAAPALVGVGSQLAGVRGADRVLAGPGAVNKAPGALAGGDNWRVASAPVLPHNASEPSVSGRAPEVMRSNSSKGGGSSDRKRIEGTLKLIGMAGQPIGEAQISATEM